MLTVDVDTEGKEISRVGIEDVVSFGIIDSKNVIAEELRDWRDFQHLKKEDMSTLIDALTNMRDRME